MCLRPEFTYILCGLTTQMHEEFLLSLNYSQRICYLYFFCCLIPSILTPNFSTIVINWATGSCACAFLLYVLNSSIDSLKLNYFLILIKNRMNTQHCIEREWVFVHSLNNGVLKSTKKKNWINSKVYVCENIPLIKV